MFHFVGSAVILIAQVLIVAGDGETECESFDAGGCTVSGDFVCEAGQVASFVSDPKCVDYRVVPFTCQEDLYAR